MKDIDFSKVKRIVVIGTSSSGKTTLGKQLSKIFKSPQTDLDDVYWLPNWTKRADEEFEALIREAVSKPTWVISGNNSEMFKKYISPNVDMIVWLDYPFTMILKRALKRSVSRIRKKISICQGNYETWRLLFSRESIILWIFKTYHKRRKKYGKMFSEMEGPILIRLKNQKETDKFLKSLK